MRAKLEGREVEPLELGKLIEETIETRRGENTQSEGECECRFIVTSCARTS
jgi:hypothetical protein